MFNLILKFTNIENLMFRRLKKMRLQAKKVFQLQNSHSFQKSDLLFLAFKNVRLSIYYYFLVKKY